MSRRHVRIFSVNSGYSSNRRAFGIAALCLAFLAGSSLVLAAPPKSSSKTGSSRTSKPRSPRTGGTRKPPKPTTRTPKKAAPVTESTAAPDEARVDANYEQSLKPAEDREYTISVQDMSYGDLLNAFSRMTGLAVLGDTPDGTVTYISSEELDYDGAVSRMRKILFAHPENFYIRRVGDSLEVLRATEMPRKLLPHEIYTSVGDFLAAELDEMEFVMVLYTPDKGRVADLEPLRDFMPDYVRIAPFRDTNALTILALARDVNKYLGYVTIFDRVEPDPRPFEFIPVRYVLASRAIEMLYEFMPALSGAAAPSTGRKPPKGRRTAATLAEVEGHGIDLYPIDERKTIFVRAMPDRIQEIKDYLLLIDVDDGLEEDPIIITLEHVRVEQLIGQLGPFYTGQSPAPAKGGKTKRGRSKVAAAGAIVTDTIEIYPNSTNNTLIVMAEQEELTRLRMYIEIFDVPSLETTVRIPVEYGDPAVIVGLVEQIIASLDPAGAPTLLQADPIEGGIVVVGRPATIEQVRELVASMDKPDEDPPGPHLYQCRNAMPTALIGLLNTLENSSGGAPAPTKKRGKRKAPSRAASGIKFHGDDATSSLWVICSEEEWNDHYLPLLEELDRSVDTSPTVIALQYGDAEDVISRITQAMGTRGKTAKPTVVPHPDGIMVFGAPEGDLAYIRNLAAEFDVDPQIERKTFTLRFADPAEVKTVLESLVVQGTGPRPTSRKRKGKAVVAAKGPQVQIVQSGRSDLIVVAPADEMEEIEGLIAELDVDPLQMTVRVYEFAVGADLRELAQTLSSFYPGQSSVSVSSRGKKGTGGKVTTRPGDIRFIPQPSARKILVSAPADMFEDIEEKIELLRPDGERTGQTIEFYAVTNLDPQTMADVLEPLLDVKYQELVDTGVLGELPVEGKKTAAAKPYSVTADPLGDRIIVVAPGQLHEDVQPLIDRLDREDRERIMKTIALEKAEPKAMVETIRGLLASGGSAAGRASKKGGKGKPAPRVTRGGDQAVIITEAPGGSAVVLSGYAEDLVEVEAWIHELDAASTDAREIKIYTPKNIGAEEFADAVMGLLDSAGVKKAPKPKATDSLFDSFDFGSTRETRKGKEIYLVFDTWAGTVLVSATPSKLREVDGLYVKFEGDPENGIEPLVDPGGDVLPYEIYTLKNRDDAGEAVWDLETYIDTLWPDPSNKPQIDYIPFSKDLIVRCRPDDYKAVEDLIVKYVDKPQEGAGIKGEEGIEVIRVENILAQDMALLLQARVGADKVRVVSASEDVGNYGVPEVKIGDNNADDVAPCVLPACVVRMMGSLAVSDDDDPASEPKTLNSPEFEEKARLKEEMLNSTRAEAAEPEADEQPLPEPIITVVPDNERGVLVIKGASQDVADLKYVIDKILEELEDLPQPPDIRVFGVRYLDVNTAASILEAMFNAPRQQLSAAQRKAQLAAERAAAAAAKKKAGGKDAAEGDKNKRPQPEVPAPQPQPQPTAGQIRIYPDARTRTLIIRAAPEQYPSILKLLAKIDRQGTDSEFRIYKLERLNAGEVEAKLKEMLGIGAARTRRTTPRQPNRGNAVQPGNQPPELAALDGESIGTTNVTISSSPATNTIMAMAPQKILELIGDLIKELEEQDIPVPVTKMVELKHGDPAEVVAQLEKLFATKGKRGGDTGFDPLGVNQPVFIADGRTNTITVRALEVDLPKILPAIEEFDREAGDRDKPRYIQLEFAKPTEIARKLQEAFGGQRGGRGGKNAPVTITGDDGSMKLIVVAPPDVFADIQDMVAKIDVERTNLDFRVYELKHASAADVLQQMTQLVQTLLRGASKTGVDLGVFSAVADEKINALVIAGEPAIFPIVEGLLAKLDIEKADTVIEVRMYRLVKAQAADVANTINRLFGRATKRGEIPPQAEANQSTNLLVVRGNKAQQDDIYAQIIQKLEEFAEQEPVKLKREIIPLVYAKADDMASSLTEMFRAEQAATAKARIPGLDPVDQAISITPDVLSNQLVVYASEGNIAVIRERVAAVDKDGVAGSAARTSETYKLQYSDPGAVVGIINQQFRKSGRVAEKDRVEAGVDWYTLTVVVTASQENHEQIAALIEKLDVDSGGGKVQQVYQLEHGRASDVANVVNQTLRQSRQTTRRGQMAVSVVANDPNDQLIISGMQKEVDEVIPLVKQLDREPIEGDLEVVVYTVKFVDPNALIGTINNAFPRVRGTRAEDYVRASYAWGTSSLVVSASEENQVKIADLIAKVDVESAVERITHTIKLTAANAEDLAGRLGQIYRQTRRRQRDDVGMSVTAEPATNMLLVYANDKEFAEVQELVAMLDVMPDDEREIRSFKFKYAEAHPLLDAVRQLFSGAGGRGRVRPRDRVDVYLEWSSNTLVVAAAPEKMERIAEFIEGLDQPGVGDRKVTVVEIENAEAASVAQSLTQVFVQRTNRGQQTVSITNPRGSDMLLIRANDKELEEIQAAITQLEAVGDASAGEMKIINLRYTDAEETRTILEEYLRKPGTQGGRRGGGAALVGDVRISVSTQNNSLIVSGSAEQLEQVAEVVAKIDVEVEDGRNVPKIIKLEHAQASEIQPHLDELFGQQRGRRGGRGASTSEPPVIEAVDSINSLIVRAGPADFNAIEKLVEQLDTADAGPASVKIIPLEYSDAEEMQTILEEYLRKPSSSGGGGRRGRRGGTSELAGDVRLSVSTQNNALILSGDAEQLEQIAEVVAQIDVQVEGSGVQIVKLENAQASVVQPQLEELFAQKRGGGRGGSTKVQTVIVANDTTNSLVVRADPADMSEILRVAKQLDSDEVGEKVRIVQVVSGMNVEAIAALVEDTFGASSQGRRSGRGGSGSAPRQLVVTADKRTNSVILAGAPAMFDEVEALIRQLENKGPKGGKKTILIRTKNVDVKDVMGVLEDLTKDGKSGSRSSGGRRSSRGR